MSEKQGKQTPKKSSYMGTGIAIGAGAGVALGVVFGVSLDNMAFMGIGIAIGVSLGVAIDAALEQRHKEDSAWAMVKVYEKEDLKCTP